MVRGDNLRGGFLRERYQLDLRGVDLREATCAEPTRREWDLKGVDLRREEST